MRTLSQVLAVAMVVLLPLACVSEGSRVESKLFRASFDQSMVDRAEETILGIAASRGMQVLQKNPEEMRVLTQGGPAFYIALLHGEKVVLSVNNVGVGDMLTVMATYHEEIDPAELDQLTAEVIGELERRFSLSFAPLGE